MCVGDRPVPAVQPHEHPWRWAAGCRGKVCRGVPLISLVADAAPAHPHLRHWYRIDAGRGLDPTFRSMACGQPAPTTTTTLHAQKAPGRGGIVVCACGGHASGAARAQHSAVARPIPHKPERADHPCAQANTALLSALADKQTAQGWCGGAEKHRVLASVMGVRGAGQQ